MLWKKAVISERPDSSGNLQVVLHGEGFLPTLLFIKHADIIEIDGGKRLSVSLDVENIHIDGSLSVKTWGTSQVLMTVREKIVTPEKLGVADRLKEVPEAGTEEPEALIMVGTSKAREEKTGVPDYILRLAEITGMQDGCVDSKGNFTAAAPDEPPPLGPIVFERMFVPRLQQSIGPAAVFTDAMREAMGSIPGVIIVEDL